MENHKVDLHLTTKQKNKFLKGETFQMTSDQCNSGPMKNKHHLCTVLSKKHYNHLLKNTHNKKSTRLHHHMFKEGSGFFKDAMKGISKGLAPVLVDKIGDLTGTRGLTDSIIKPNVNQFIDSVAGSGFYNDNTRPSMMPIYKSAVMPNKEVGEGLKKKGRFVKGSPEAKVFMNSIRKKKGSNIFDDLGNKLKETFNPDLGRKIQNALTSPVAKTIYKGVADTVIPIISSENPILGQIAKSGVDQALGSGLKKKIANRQRRIKTMDSTLIGGVPQTINGGSFKGF